VLDIVFWVLAIVAVLAALAVLILRDVFRAAMALILLFLTIAAIYVTLSADFLAVVQILIYVGAISILIIVGIMLTQNVKQGNPSGRLVIPALVTGIMLVIILALSISRTFWNISNEAPVQNTTAPLGQLMFGPEGYLFPVEMIAILVLTAILGAIVLLREK